VKEKLQISLVRNNIKAQWKNSN